MQDINRSVIAIGITCSLLGCGGGGGGSNLISEGSSELVTITKENGEKVAKAAVATSDNLVASNSVSGLWYC